MLPGLLAHGRVLDNPVGAELHQGLDPGLRAPLLELNLDEHRSQQTNEVVIVLIHPSI